MDRDTVVKLAREAHFYEMPPGLWTTYMNMSSVEDADLMRFATLVRNAALEEAAKHIEKEAFGSDEYEFGCYQSAIAIRALKE